MMKKQYLGDSKDSFKWDYHDFLVRELNYQFLNVVLMLTPDNKSNEGQTPPTLFPARKEVIKFCNDLKNTRDIDIITNLPYRTGAKYRINLHNCGTYITNQNRKIYFSGLLSNEDQLLLVDPDIGFEPEKSFSKQHVLYADIVNILEQVSARSVVSVFQHFRRKPFVRDFVRIKERLEAGYTTAIYWQSLMFVGISKSETAIARVAEANKKYSKDKKHVKILA
jgi:hypothetical protein